jgi:hypothetical protein
VTQERPGPAAGAAGGVARRLRRARQVAAHLTRRKPAEIEAPAARPSSPWPRTSKSSPLAPPAPTLPPRQPCCLCPPRFRRSSRHSEGLQASNGSGLQPGARADRDAVNKGHGGPARPGSGLPNYSPAAHTYLCRGRAAVFVVLVVVVVLVGVIIIMAVVVVVVCFL